MTPRRQKNEGSRHGQPRISNRCPACGHPTLFIAVGGWLTCGWGTCPNPGAIGDLAEDARAKDINTRRSTPTEETP